MKQYIRVGAAVLALDMEENMVLPETFRTFVCDAQEAMVTYTLRVTEDMENVVQDTRARAAARYAHSTMDVLLLPAGEARILQYIGADKPYAVYEEVSESDIRVLMDRDTATLMGQSETVLASMLSLEKQLLRVGEMILHSAYICHDGQAILFSAPSQTGKSTQAGLWERYRKARTINGDLSLLTRGKDGWYAAGFPTCGSSKTCYDERYPIRAIVMLYQDKENTVRRISGMQAFKLLMAQIKVNMWNADYQERVFSLIEQVIGEVPVLEMGCNISENAVDTLHEALENM